MGSLPDSITTHARMSTSQSVIYINIKVPVVFRREKVYKDGLYGLDNTHSLLLSTSERRRRLLL